MHNRAERVELFSIGLRNLRHLWLAPHMLLCTQSAGGQLWLRKLATGTDARVFPSAGKRQKQAMDSNRRR